MTQYFHFTLGPVQGFVAQARRTRDLWSGSFLLSFLSAVAIKETQKQGGTILFPLPDQDFLDALETSGQHSQPQQGSIPNRFKAEVDENFTPQKVIQAVQTAWQAIANQVLQQDLKNHPQWSEKQQQNWDTQIQHFWEIVWAMTEDKADAAILDKRKNWRSHLQPTQYGDKCMMMEGYQELSCAERPNAKSQKAFWTKLQSQFKTDLREGEKLCAMAFVKRRFAHHFANLSVDMPSNWTLKGWKLPHNVPSVQYLAAVHWLEQLLQKQADDTNVNNIADTFYQQAKKIVSLGEVHSKINCIQAAPFHPIANLDGAVFYSSLLESGSAFDHPQPNLLNTLKQLNKAANQEPVSPFFAVLMMDGDSLGVQMSDPTKQADISKGLDKFTKQIPHIIHQNNGFLIYAGGDDVLAILPLEDAIQAAIECRTHYLDCFKNTPVNTTLSGAIEFVHIKSPLMKSIFNAHQLLDEVAKEQTGRDAIAIRVMKPGNENAIWSMPWQYTLDQQNSFLLEKLSTLFKDGSADGKGLSSQFIYKLRDQYQNFDLTAFQDNELEDLLLVDYLSSGKAVLSEKEARSLIQLLIQLSTQYHRDNIEQPYQKTKQLDMNAALIARFLAQKGVE